MKKDTYAPGEPCWIDCGTDLEKGPAFYSSLFGWTTTSLGPDAGGYTMAAQGDVQVAGFGPQQNPGSPTWSVYFAVDDVAKTAERVRANGGSVLAEPMQVMEAGHMAVFADPTGAVFSVWQPGQHTGFGELNAPGTFCWAELITDDVAKVTPFYEAVFGWGTRQGTDPSMPYTEVLVGDESVAGMMPRPESMPAEVPSYWGIYFAVDNTDATIGKVAELGGSTIVEPMDVPPGRFATCVDSQGAVFSVITLTT
jgi:predicted enzyme related to lactoylglutathione lyase